MWELVAGYALGRLDEKRRSNNLFRSLNQQTHPNEPYRQQQYDIQMEMADELSLMMYEEKEYLGELEQVQTHATRIFLGMVYVDGQIDNEELELGYGLITQIFETELAVNFYKDIQKEFVGISKDKCINKGVASAKLLYKNFENREEISNEDWEFVLIMLALLGLSDSKFTNDEKKYLVAIGKVFKLKKIQVENLLEETVDYSKEVASRQEFNVVEELENAASLLEKGLITEEEFENIKSKLLS
tara:strand:- start:104 stop:835 length:732 start_codon:yes stop_codon:yes gene_type:complete